MKTYFKNLGLPTPAVSSVSVDHGTNRPTGSPDGPDGEVMLDIEVAGAIAPKAKIVVYFAPNTSQGFLDAITHAVHDTVHKPSVISISWGGPESDWTGQAFQQFDQAFQAAAALGVTICVAAGDNGSSDGVDDGQAHVDFPASSPNVLACGGTRLNASGTKISSEIVWNEPNMGSTGGGVSDEFPLPNYQERAGVPASANPSHKVGRGVPDVAADADPATGYVVRVDGEDTVIGGTSAVAPLWAGLIARLNQGARQTRGIRQPNALWPRFAERGLSRYQPGQQWRILRRTGLGRVHRRGRRRRHQAAASSFDVITVLSATEQTVRPRADLVRFARAPDARRITTRLAVPRIPSDGSPIHPTTSRRGTMSVCRSAGAVEARALAGSAVLKAPISHRISPAPSHRLAIQLLGRIRTGDGRLSLRQAAKRV